METALFKNRQVQSGKKILVIEDDPFWQQVIRKCLHNVDKKADVRMVENTKEFRLKVQNLERFDLIISDHYLGDGQTGLELWQDLQNEKLETPFLLFSGLERGELLQLTGNPAVLPSFVEKSLIGDSFVNSVRGILADDLGHLAVEPRLESNGADRLLMLATFIGLAYCVSTSLNQGLILNPELKAGETDAKPTEHHLPLSSIVSRPKLKLDGPIVASNTALKDTSSLQVRLQVARILKRADAINGEATKSARRK